MKVVIDTNVIVSAVLRDRLPETVILFVVEQSDIEWLATDEILDEYLSVLSRPKFGLSATLLDRWASLFQQTMTLLSDVPEVSFPRDQKDARFLACCLSGNADFFVTGDRDFEEARQLVDTKIVSLNLFRQLVMNDS